jgi:hypothetical protein
MAELRENMVPSTGFIPHVESLSGDPLRTARQIAGAGNRVVGHVGDDVPPALILASGALPLSLRSGGLASTPQADRILESAFSPMAREVTERWLSGELDFLHSVVFSRADDSSQRLYYYLCELQRRGQCSGPRPLLYDIARIARPTSVGHTRDSTRKLAAELAVDAAKLAPAMERVARRETILDDLRAHRRQDAPLPGSLGWRVQRAAAFDWRESFDDAARDWLRGPPTLSSPRRLILVGNAPTDASLHLAVEAAGGSVVADFTDPSRLPAGAITLDALADAVHAQRSPVLAMRDDASWTMARAREARAEAVIFWLIEEDEALPWEIARQMNRLRAEGVPALLLARQPWSVDDHARAQVREFVSGIEVTR